MSMPTDPTAEYVCENDECPDAGKIRSIQAEGSSECPTCGWFMQAVR